MNLLKMDFTSPQNYTSLYLPVTGQNDNLVINGLPGGKGLNIAYEAVDRHADSDLKNTVALCWIQKDRSTKNFTYGELKILTARFANVLDHLGIKKGERVFSLAGRIPELYIAA